MKNNELLYELMNDINDVEAVMIENDMQADVDEVSLKRQELLVMDRIHAEQEKLKKRSRGGFSRKKLIVLVAAVVMMFSMLGFARANDWDIEFAELVGLPGAMEALEGGYVEISVSDTQDGITVTAVRSIGDKNNQWIQIDTDVPWEVGENGYYMFDEYETYFSNFLGSGTAGSSTFYGYNNDGMVSFMLQVGVEKINRLNVSITFGNLYKCEGSEEKELIISDAIWELQWKNYYAPNTITKNLRAEIDDIVIRTVEISPISIRVEASGSHSRYDNPVVVESVTLDDGTVILCAESGSGNHNGIYYDVDSMYQDMTVVDIEKVKYVTINGKEIELK